MSASGSYAWAPRADRPTEERRQALVGVIEEDHAEVKGRYGSPRMTPGLKARGHDGSENMVTGLMREHGIRAKAPRRFVRTTDSRHGLPVADNLLDRDFDPPGPSESWSADITPVPTREGWVYLAVVEDLFRRLVVGWAMDGAMTSRLAVDAREMAVRRRRLPGEGLVAHADRGSPYAGAHDQRVLSSAGVVCSTNRRGDCWDNAPVESFFGSLKRELVRSERYTTRDEARASSFESIEVFYNRVRRYSSLGYVSPAAFERTHNPKHPIPVYMRHSTVTCSGS